MRVAVVGAGIAGLGAAFLLARRHDVTVFTADRHLGGHSNTVDAVRGERRIPVDTGFIVYNTACYPNLIALFEHLGVETAATDMSFAVSLDGGNYEYDGSGLTGYFGQPSNIFSPRHWMMARDILRFFREAPGLVSAPAGLNVSLGDWLDESGYSSAFVERHILPMGAAIWSTPANEILDFPAQAFARFFSNHGLLSLSGRPQWRTVTGGSRRYVEKITAASRFKAITADAVTRVMRNEKDVRIETRSGAADTFDACLIATHADQALAMLEDADGAEREVLGAFRYAKNQTVLHTDASFMPRRRRLWSSWNYTGARQSDGMPCVSYWMNRLQPLQTSENFFVTLNAGTPIGDEHIIHAETYMHPLFDRRALEAQADLWPLQGRRRTWFAGSYFAYGFHEDALQAGLAVAEQLGSVRRPWNVTGESDRLKLLPGAGGRADTEAVQ